MTILINDNNNHDDDERTDIMIYDYYKNIIDMVLVLVLAWRCYLIMCANQFLPIANIIIILFAHIYTLCAHMLTGFGIPVCGG